MKKILLFSFVLCGLCFACHKEEAPPLSTTALPNAWAGPQTYGWVKASRDGKDWIGSSFAGIENTGDDPRASIGFQTFDTDTVNLEELSFVRIPLKAGKYRITDSATSEQSIYWVGYFDEIDALYEIDKKKKSYLWIDSYDPASKVITGRFQSFYIKSDNFRFNHPAKLSFTDGSFSVKLY